MKKLIAILSVLTITSSAVPSTIACSKEVKKMKEQIAEKQEELEKQKAQLQQTEKELNEKKMKFKI